MKKHREEGGAEFPSTFMVGESQCRYLASQKNISDLGRRQHPSITPFLRFHLIPVPRSLLGSLRLFEEEDGWVFEIGYRDQNAHLMKNEVNGSFEFFDDPAEEKEKKIH